jgi:hypothetical protein
LDEKCPPDGSSPTLIGHEQHSPQFPYRWPAAVLDSLPRGGSNYKIGEMGETIGLSPKADLARLSKGCILSFDDAPPVDDDLG